jgi:hypothetical protein
MTYFKELPNIQVLNRTKNEVSNDETLIVKNIFKRAKLREDVSTITAAFEYYIITENERPDEIAEKIYGDPELDWVILTTNNIINVQDEWPLTLDNFNNYMLEKYGSEDAFSEIRYYESISTRDTFGREVFPAGVVLDEAFYKSPEYVSVEEIPPGITFPPIYIPGTQAVLTPIVGFGNSIQSIQITNAGLGYTQIPTIDISNPPITSNASANCLIGNFRVSSIVSIVGGQGYNNSPQVTFSSPVQSVQSTAECDLGDGINIDKVTTIKNLVGGIGYGLTAPTVTFSPSPRTIVGSYNKESPIAVGNNIEGFYLNDAGNYLYTASFTGANQIKQYTLSSVWSIDTILLTYELDVSADFNYTTGVEFKPDGTIMYVTGGVGLSYKIVSYGLSTAWNLSTATKLNQITIASPGGIRFKPDGTRVFILDFSNPDVIREYSVGTPWDITTRSGSTISSLNITTTTGDNSILGFTFNSNGTKLFATSQDSSSIYEFNLQSWQLNTATYAYDFYVGDRIGEPCDIFIQPNNEKFIVGGDPSNKLFEYTLISTAKGVAEVTGGSVSNINITNSGVGYTVPPTITIGNPYPAVTATGTANLTSGIVTSITITNTGFGYTAAPTVSIENAPISRKATITFQLINTGIGNIQIIDGGTNYVTTPTITVSLPEEILNVEVGGLYNQNQTTWRWTGTEWQEKITEEFQYFDPTTNSIIRIPGSSLCRPISNYEYESRLNEEKRKLIILKPQYLPAVINDLRNIMTYNQDDPNYINDKLKRTYNEKIMRI